MSWVRYPTRLGITEMQEHSQFLMWNSCGFPSCSTSKFLLGHRLRVVLLCPTARHSMWRLLCVAGALVSLFSGSLGYSDILSAKRDAEKNICLSCPLKKKVGRGGVRFAVDQSTATRREVAASGFHETTWTRYEARVVLLGQVNSECHRAQTVSPF